MGDICMLSHQSSGFRPDFVILQILKPCKTNAKHRKLKLNLETVRVVFSRINPTIYLFGIIFNDSTARIIGGSYAMFTFELIKT